MKKINGYLFPAIMIACLTSCSGMYYCRKHFVVFKETITLDYGNTRIKTNGIYVSKNNSGAFILYTNGSIKTIGSNFPDGKHFWEDPKNVLEELQTFWNYYSKETWGHYAIKNDEFISQTFGFNGMEFCKRSVYEQSGKILNDSTIALYSDYSFWFKSNLLEEPNIFGFYPTNQKPDSTKAWFNNKTWFRKNLHESRKIEK